MSHWVYRLRKRCADAERENELLTGINERLTCNIEETLGMIEELKAQIRDKDLLEKETEREWRFRLRMKNVVIDNLSKTIERISGLKDTWE